MLVLLYFVVVFGVLVVMDLFVMLLEKFVCIFNKGDVFNIYVLLVLLLKVVVMMDWYEYFYDDEGNVWMCDLMIDIFVSFKMM